MSTNDERARRLAAWRPTVYDARRLLRGALGRRHTLVMEDGEVGPSPWTARILDVIHRPGEGYLLKLRDFRSVRRYADTVGEGSDRSRRVQTVSVRAFHELPEPFAFLLLPEDQWPIPPDVVACTCGRPVVGRFCGQCGAKVRTTAHLGRAFAVDQRLLREGAMVPPHACGAMPEPGARHCSKCSLPLAAEGDAR
jgi:hypothetical protein